MLVLILLMLPVYGEKNDRAAGDISLQEFWAGTVFPYFLPSSSTVPLQLFESQYRRPPRYRGRGPGYGGGAHFSIKFAGGMDYLLLGDLNNHFKGMNSSFNDMADPGTLNGRFRELRWAWDGYGELIFYPTPVFGIGIGGGYLRARTRNDTVTFTTFGGLWSDTREEDWIISAIPLRLSLHFTLPVGPAANISLSLGGAYYFGSLEMNRETESLLWTGTENAKGKSMNTIGGHGGISFELKMSPNFSFVLEAQGRYAKFTSIKADLRAQGILFLIIPIDYNAENTLFFYQYNSGTNTYDTLEWWETAPSGPAYNSLREGTIDLSGVFFGAGFKFTF